MSIITKINEDFKIKNGEKNYKFFNEFHCKKSMIDLSNEIETLEKEYLIICYHDDIKNEIKSLKLELKKRGGYYKQKNFY